MTAEALLASSGASAAGIIGYLTNGFTGLARVAGIALEAALLEMAIVRARLSPVLLAGVVVVVAVAGHGADVEPAWPGIAVNAVYLAAAGVWAGGIMALALLRVTGPLAGRGTRPAAAVHAGRAMGVSRIARPGGGAGGRNSSAARAVLTTPYGLTLVAKAVAVAAHGPPLAARLAANTGEGAGGGSDCPRS